MSVKVEIYNSHQGRTRVINVSSIDANGMCWHSRTEVDDIVLRGRFAPSFDEMIDMEVRKHCREMADRMFANWKRGN